MMDGWIDGWVEGGIDGCRTDAEMEGWRVEGWMKNRRMDGRQTRFI